MSKKREAAPCFVCGTTERTSSHFGSNACMACASFFRRTVSFGIRFLCKANNNCTISPDVRFICRSCRYDNCIRVGMRKDLVQQKRDDSRIPKYVLESRKGGVTEVVRGYTTSNYVNYKEQGSSGSTCSSKSTSVSPVSTRSSSPDGSECSTILSVTHDELLLYYVKKVKMATLHRQFEVPEDTLQQFLISKQINDRLALDLCTSCPGTDLLEKSDLEILFRHCSFVSLWLDSAWITSVNNKDDISRKDIDMEQKSKFNGNSQKNILIDFVTRFQSVISVELARLQLDVTEYAALKSFCIWKLGIVDTTLTLKIIAAEQYMGVTNALSKHYQCVETMESFQIATRLADITLMLGSIFMMYRETLELYETLGISCSIDST